MDTRIVTTDADFDALAPAWLALEEADPETTAAIERACLGALDAPAGVAPVVDACLALGLGEEAVLEVGPALAPALGVVPIVPIVDLALHLYRVVPLALAAVPALRL